MKKFAFEWYEALMSAIASSLLITGFVCIMFYIITSPQTNESHSVNEDIFKAVFIAVIIPILYFVYMLIKGSCTLLSLIRSRRINHSSKDLNLDDAVQNLNDLRDKGLIDQHDYAEQLHKIVTKRMGR
jgi:amino acid permease